MSSCNMVFAKSVKQRVEYEVKNNIDNAYYYSAAFERYMMINGVFENRISECRKAIINVPGFLPESYL